MANHTFYSVRYSKSIVFRLLIFTTLFLITYLFIAKLNLSLLTVFIEKIFKSLINFDQINRTFYATPIKINIQSNTNNTVLDRDLLNKLKTIQNTNISQQPKEAFVTFSNNQPMYLALLKVLLDSVHAFSTRPIIAFGIDVDLNIDINQYPRVIKRRISQNDCGPSVYFCKLYAIVNSNVEYGVLMETDDVVNYNVDILFDVLHVWPYPLPLSPRHPDDPQNYYHFMRIHNVSMRTTPYIHAHIIWNYRALPFLRNVLSLLRQGHFQGANFDETAVNVMLWHAQADHTLCKYDPYFASSEAYERWPSVTNCDKSCYTVFITLHGSKDASISGKLLDRLKTMKGKPALQTPGMNGMKHINDSNATCCYPDSQPSPIHPLLCKHNSRS